MEVKFALSLLAQSVAPKLARVSAFQLCFIRLRLLVFQRSLALVRQPGELGRYRVTNKAGIFNTMQNA